ncbi:DNA (cytosine-5)-methyltransferase 1B-like [Phalaenopsis equestris]|uniref:DNA (cytosine-5)-methyltransferase 1B-like n=1 Tax=Phalaenopsis equestris TaxID=78828 RepID=UPI0009E3B799|nr:DNA (cytosine-5)-methyltransferase 1B-like [Phalaenopsis equestris]XP_020578798.1 DNA (cytosine-5)-methyltransferase 1B-like [Phalaenopsis equestris]
MPGINKSEIQVMNRKTTSKCSTKKSKRKVAVEEAHGVKDSKENGHIINCAEEPVIRKRPKRSASCLNFKEKNVRLSDRFSVVETKEIRVVEEEKDAVELTILGAEDLPPCRKLVDFVFHDTDGKPQPFEVCEFDDIYITSVIMPMDDNLEKEKEKGVKCEGFGRIESWSISGYDEGSPIVWVMTEIAEYECVKPASSYKRFFNHFNEKARICIEVYKILNKSTGRNPDLSLEELLAGVIRSISGTTGPSGVVNRDLIISLGEFIYNQLIGLDETPEGSNASLAKRSALCALRDECRSRGGLREKIDGTLKIDGRKSLLIDEDEDEKLARLLQEEENWNLMKQQRGSQSRNSNIYIKISEAEIANDYPLPAYYKPAVDEMDEYIFFDTESSIHYVDLPRRILTNWSLYNSDSRLISLELLPMKPCAETDVLVFGSGNMREDDGSGFCMELDVGGSSSSITDCANSEGVPVYLSSIKEWMIEFGSSMIFISVRTDVAWYRLGKPAKQYAPWYEPVLKTASLAISIITLLKEQTRASKLSFADVIKKITEFEREDPAYISSNIAAVERYVVVHGQIILQQFAEYPDKTIKKCSFVTSLSAKMEERLHTKLAMKKKLVVQKEDNLNPSAAMRPLISKRKVMRATTTRLINRIWGDYYSSHFPDEFKEEVENVLKDEEVEDEQEENEEEEIEEQRCVVQEIDSKSFLSKSFHDSKSNGEEIRWEGDPIGKKDSGEVLYKRAIVHGEKISVGGVVVIDGLQPSKVPTLFFVEFLYMRSDGVKMAHGRIMLRGVQTILGNAANEREVFLTNNCNDFALEDMKEAVHVDIRLISWGYQYRKEFAEAAKIDRMKAEEKKKKGLPMDFFCKSLYCPERGAFFALPYDSLGLGSGFCSSCRGRENKECQVKASSKETFIFKKTEYYIHEFIYVNPYCFVEEDKEHETFKASRNIGLMAYVVCQILEISFHEGAKNSTQHVKVRRFYRPEDISAAKAYTADIREVYYSEDLHEVPIDMIQGKCSVIKKNNLPSLDLPVIMDHIFFCECFYDPTQGSLKQLPSNSKLWATIRSTLNPCKMKKGKEKCEEGQQTERNMWKELPQENRLATLDIFAGCGGLSEGLQQSGATFTKWAIEYEEAAGEAFNKNHPDAHMFIDNCNVILRAIMEKCGEADDCISTSEAAELAAKLGEEKLKNLPMPGQVDFINGGPPCQGFSGMNRFSHSTWSKVQCEMILAFLSFAEYFRPRFFLLENVRNFVSFNKGQTFRLTLASLLEMGYQVRFGILEAGAYGVSQSRKRAFIWAASPEETLPEWPEPMHVFASPELKISLNGNMQYSAVRSTADGAPFRSITVRDTIGDLPFAENGASKLIVDYGGEPVSWFQKNIRGVSAVLSDHISKEMNELNLIRCKRIPKHPGADWRDLPDEKVKLSNGQMVDLVPWCLPNTAMRHNQWKGLFGRLDWEGNFPTSITDPQPMGKVGMCFHPDQDRILTVRECARSQGFRDSYIFAGNIQNKHRQIGNAVPPPLAYALGRKLKEVVDANHSST